MFEPLSNDAMQTATSDRREAGIQRLLGQAVVEGVAAVGNCEQTGRHGIVERLLQQPLHPHRRSTRRPGRTRRRARSPPPGHLGPPATSREKRSAIASLTLVGASTSVSGRQTHSPSTRVTSPRSRRADRISASEERVALRVPMNEIAELVRDLGLAQSLGDQASRRAPVETTDSDRLSEPLPIQRVRENAHRVIGPDLGATIRPQQKHSVCHGVPHQVGQQLQRGVVGPVQVIEQDRHGPMLRHLLDQAGGGAVEHAAQRRARSTPAARPTGAGREAGSPTMASDPRSFRERPAE